MLSFEAPFSIFCSSQHDCIRKFFVSIRLFISIFSYCKQSYRIQTTKTGGQMYCEISPYKVFEYYLVHPCCSSLELSPSLPPSLPPSLSLSLLLYFHLLALLLYFYLLIILLYFYLLLLLLFLLSLFCCFHSISRWHVVGRSGARYSTNFYFYYNWWLNYVFFLCVAVWPQMCSFIKENLYADDTDCLLDPSAHGAL